MFTRENRLVSVKWGYSGATSADAAAVSELLAGKDGRDNVLVAMAFVDFNERSGQLAIAADLQPGVTAEEVETAIERKLACGSLQRV